MKKSIRAGCTIWFFIMLSMMGCSQESDIYLEEHGENTLKVQELESSDSAEQVLEQVLEQDVSENLQEEYLCYVYICGAVEQPGVYGLPEGSRIFEVIEAAGGLTADADETLVNQAEIITDGMMIQIYTTAEAEVLSEKTAVEEASGDGRIDINTATANDFMTLPGIGSAKADAIVSYREEHGYFSVIEDLMKVPGIKEGTFHQIKEHIKVND